MCANRPTDKHTTLYGIASCTPRFARFRSPIKPLICDIVYSTNIDFTPTLQIIETYLYSRSILTCCLRSIFWASALRLSGLYSYRKTETWTDLPNVQLGFYCSGRWLNSVESRQWTRSRWVPIVPSSLVTIMNSVEGFPSKTFGNDDSISEKE